MKWIKRLFSKDNDQYMTLMALAKETGIEHGTLRKAIFDGRLDARKSGWAWLSTPEAVEDAIQAGRIRRPDPSR